jgi:hypothetical protein
MTEPPFADGEKWLDQQGAASQYWCLGVTSDGPEPVLS